MSSAKGALRYMSDKKIVGFHTLGCKVNQSETEAMAALFRADGLDMSVGGKKQMNQE